MASSHEIGGYLRRCRETFDMTVGDLAYEAGLTKFEVAMMEGGKMPISEPARWRLEKVLRTPQGALVGPPKPSKGSWWDAPGPECKARMEKVEAHLSKKKAD